MELKGILEKKKVLLAACGVVLVIAASMIVFFATRGPKGYRNIQIYALDGSVTLERADVGKMDAYENLALKSEDKLNVDKESTARLKMDEDKYMLIEPESVISIQALGSAKNSETDIYLEKGAVTVEIQKKLSKKSSYRVSTPNSVMAVRGTVFRTELTSDEDGNEETRLLAFEGTVAVASINEDGSLSEEMLVHAGEEAVFTTVDGKVEMNIYDSIDYDHVSSYALTYLEEITEGGRELCISKDKLEDLIKKQSAQNAEQNKNDNKQQEQARQDEPRNTADTANESNASSQQNQQEAQPTAKPKAASSQRKQVHTVTFMYQGEAFATQEIEDGQTAAEPSLKPAQDGSWDFDFKTPIQSDTIIEFK